MSSKTYGVTRINAIGLVFLITAAEDNKTTVQHEDNIVTMDLTFDEVMQCWYNWQMKMQPIQTAFEKLPPEQREFLLTGITPQKWNEIFAPFKEEED